MVDEGFQIYGIKENKLIGVIEGPLGTLYEREDGKIWKVTSYNVFSRDVKLTCGDDYEFVPLQNALKFKKVSKKQWEH